MPGAELPRPLVADLYGLRRGEPWEDDLLDVRVQDGELPEQVVSVRLPRSRPFFVSDPTALALDEQCAGQAPVLRTVAACLDREAPVDLAQRRRPAHREPHEDAEAGRLSHDRTLDPYALPDPLDSRAWRLRAP